MKANASDAGAWHPIWLIKKDNAPTEAKDVVSPVWHEKTRRQLTCIHFQEHNAVSGPLEASESADEPSHAWHPIWLIRKDNAPDDLKVCHIMD